MEKHINPNRAIIFGMIALLLFFLAQETGFANKDLVAADELLSFQHGQDESELALENWMLDPGYLSEVVSKTSHYQRSKVNSTKRFKIDCLPFGGLLPLEKTQSENAKSTKTLKEIK